MSTTQNQENKMGIMPIPKLLISMSLPIALSMLVQALYNVIDSMFVARVSEAAFTAVSLTFPVQNIIISLAAGTGVGINALLSRYLGEKRPEKANEVAKNGVFLALVTAAVFTVLGTSLSHLFFALQTDDTVIVHYGSQYMFIISLFSFAILLQITFERLLQSTGKTLYSMIAQATGAIINIILDPILIFGLFGLPRLEVAGAALATVTGQTVAFLIALYFNCKKNKEINFSLRHFKPSKQTIGKIYAVGVPAIIMQSVGSVMTFGINKILLMFSSTAAAVFGACFKLQSFFFMPIFGLSNGMVPIIAYNYGAEQKKRIQDTFKMALLVALAITTLGLILFHAIPVFLLKIFGASEQMLTMGIPAMRLIGLSFPFASVVVVCSALFQALGNGVYSLIVAVARQLIVLLPVAYLCAKIGGVGAVWYAFPIAEIVSVVISLILKRKIYKDRLSKFA